MNDDALDASTGRQPGRGLDELLHVVYLSRAAAGTDPEKWLPELERNARARNDAAQIRGVLAYCRGWFLQWLEGPAAAVVETMGRIAVDKRHRDVQVIYEASGPQQLNSPWSLIRVARVDDAETLDARVRSLATALPGDSVEPQDFVRAFTMPYGRQGLDDIASQRPVVVTGANMIWASAVVSQAAHVSRVELARTRLQSPDLRDTDGLVEYLTTTDGLTVIAIASSTMPGGYLEGIYHRAKLIVFLIRSSDINHKIELLRGLMTIHTVAEHRPTFLFAFSTAAASHKHEFLQVADSLRVPYTEITVPLADSAMLWRTIQERLAATVLPLHANRMHLRGVEPDTRSSAESGPAISPPPATPIGSSASRSAAATPALPPPSAAVAPAISAAVPAANSFVSQPVTKGDFDMANVAESLKAILSIDGAMGCALVDVDSGMALGTAGGGINLEIAAAGNTEVVRAKLRVAKSLGITGGIEDILITLQDQYHLIRPLTKKGTLFLYVVIDRKKGNLAMGRYKVSEVEASLIV